MSLRKRVLVIGITGLLVIIAFLIWQPNPADAGKSAAIQQAVNVFQLLPSPIDVTVGDKQQVSTARRLADAAKAAGAYDFEIPNLQKLVACEQKLAELEKGAKDRNDVIGAAVAAINGLPPAKYLTYGQKDQVVEARNLVNTAMSQGVRDTEISNLTKLTEAEARMLILAELENEKITAINAAIHAIDALPAPDRVALQHKGAVIAVRSWVEAAKEKGAKDSDIANLKKLQDCEAKLASLERMASFKLEAAKAAVVAINQLPEPGSISLEERAEVLRARALVDLALQ